MISRNDPRIMKTRKQILENWSLSDLWSHLEKHTLDRDLMTLETLLRKSAAWQLDPEGWTGGGCGGCGKKH